MTEVERFSELSLLCQSHCIYECFHEANNSPSPLQTYFEWGALSELKKTVFVGSFLRAYRIPLTILQYYGHAENLAMCLLAIAMTASGAL